MVFLSFDIEEFDLPLEYGHALPFEKQIEVSAAGAVRILDLLQQKNIRATFFCTVNFAQHASFIVQRIVQEGHELASHGYFHSQFQTEHLLSSKRFLEEQFETTIAGFRMPRMVQSDAGELTKAGYRYSSSLNPTFLPGKYNHFSSPRRIFREGALFQIPASVSPVLRIPLFWLSLHNFPLSVYKFLANAALKQDGYLNLYFHPWEFIDLKRSGLDLPTYVMRHSGEALAGRLGNVIEFFLAKASPFGRLDECAALFGTE